jgi:hypothetical protein
MYPKGIAASKATSALREPLVFFFETTKTPKNKTMNQTIVNQRPKSESIKEPNLSQVALARRAVNNRV